MSWWRRGQDPEAEPDTEGGDAAGVGREYQAGESDPAGEPGAAGAGEGEATETQPAAGDAEATRVGTREGSLSVTGLTPRPEGPWDVAERPETPQHLDLGALRMPGREGMELRLDLDEASGTITAATIQLAGSMVQLQVFAAPRTEGLWHEIRTEIAAGIQRQGGTVDDVPGVFGRELMARIPVRTADGRTGTQPARFMGIDGPRWFLRAVVHGAAVHDPEAGAQIEGLIRETVVVRGAEAMAPRDLLPLRLPGGLDAATAEPAAGPDRSHLDPFERGPEITEIH